MSYFQFKQFRIDQDKTAMKVCTDSCILGAWMSNLQAKHILDIGTGTGLLALMIAQKQQNSEIDAVEIEENAFEQAKYNIQNSPFKNVKIFHESVQNYAKTSKKYYDLIVSNPPFFENHLKSTSKNINTALHSEKLSLLELAESVNQLLDKKGRFAVLLPPYQSKVLENILIDFDFYISKQLLVYNKPQKPLFRVINIFQKENVDLKQESLFIRNLDNQYSEEFESLLREYYLIF